LTLQVIAPLPPVCVNCCDQVLPTVPAGNAPAAGLTIIGGQVMSKASEVALISTPLLATSV
jgi:hypothetical protein